MARTRQTPITWCLVPHSVAFWPARATAYSEYRRDHDKNNLRTLYLVIAPKTPTGTPSDLIFGLIVPFRPLQRRVDALADVGHLLSAALQHAGVKSTGRGD